MVDTWRHLVTGTQPQNETFAQNYNVGNKIKVPKLFFQPFAFLVGNWLLVSLVGKNDVHSQIAALPEWTAIFFDKI